MVDKHNLALDKPSAWREQAGYYRDYLKEDKIGPIYCIIELGVDYGYSLFTMAHDYPKSLVIGVDKFCYGGVDGAKDRKEHLKTHIPNYPNIRLMEIDTADLGRRWKSHEFYVDVDVLHIDAGHSYDEVKADFEAWWPHVRPGGVVMFHDVESFPDDVGRFFGELEGEKYIQGNLGVIYKP